MGLFTPKWKHEDPARRMAAVEKLTKEEQLAYVALHDSVKEIRETAIDRISDVETLLKLRRRDRDSAMRKKADDRIDTLAGDGSLKAMEVTKNRELIMKTARDSSSPQVRKQAILRILDQKYLYELYGKEKDRTNRAIIIDKIEDEEIARKVADREKDDLLRAKAVRLIYDQEFLADFICRESNFHIQRIIFSRLTDSFRHVDILSSGLSQYTSELMNAGLKTQEDLERTVKSKSVIGSSAKDIAIRRLENQEFLGRIALNQDEFFMNGSYGLWERLAAVETIDDPMVLLKVAFKEMNGVEGVTLFNAALDNLSDLAVIDEALGLDEMDRPEYILFKINLEKRKEIVESALKERDPFRFYFDKLMVVMERAYLWGGENGWPLMKDYPQFGEIQAIGEELFDLDEERTLEKACAESSGFNEDFPGMLNHFFDGIGDWTP